MNVPGAGRVGTACGDGSVTDTVAFPVVLPIHVHRCTHTYTLQDFLGRTARVDQLGVAKSGRPKDAIDDHLGVAEEGWRRDAMLLSMLGSH